MKRAISIVTAFAVAVLVTLTISVAAQDFNTLEKTYLTFSGPVELPGLRLEGGTYVFRLADTAGRNVVQVLSQDEKDILGQWLFIQAERPEVSGETVIAFRETTAGATPAIQYWYYPGEKIGKEFVYPKDQALRIAARTGATVQSVEGEITAESEVAAVERSTQAGAAEATAAAETPAPAESVSVQAEAAVVEGAGLPEDAEAQAVGTTGVQQESDAAPADTLPATASPLALSGLLGLLSLAGAAGIRFFRP